MLGRPTPKGRLMVFSDSQHELQTGGAPCSACLGAHRRHTCALGKSGPMLTAPAEPTAAPAAPAVPSTVPTVGPTADANGGVERDAAAASAASAVAAEGAATEPTRVSHRRSAPPLRLVEDGAGRLGSAHTRRKPAATAHDAAATASATVEQTAIAEPPAGAALAAPRVAAAAAARVSASTACPAAAASSTAASTAAAAATDAAAAAAAADAAAAAADAAADAAAAAAAAATGAAAAAGPLGDASTAPVLWVGDSTFVRLTGCDAWGALQLGDLRSEIKSVNGEKPCGQHAERWKCPLGGATASMVTRPTWQRPSSVPAPSQGASGTHGLWPGLLRWQLAAYRAAAAPPLTPHPSP